MRGVPGRIVATAQLVFFAITARTVPFRGVVPGAESPTGAARPGEGEKAAAATSAPSAEGPGSRPGSAGGPQVARSCTPWQIKGGMGHLADSRGELALFFPGCFGIAGPALLFRLKREGFSGCTVEVTGQGLLVRGMR